MLAFFRKHHEKPVTDQSAWGLASCDLAKH